MMRKAHNSVSETVAKSSSNILQPFQAPVEAAVGEVPLRLTQNAPGTHLPRESTGRRQPMPEVG